MIQFMPRAILSRADNGFIVTTIERDGTPSTMLALSIEHALVLLAAQLEKIAKERPSAPGDEGAESIERQMASVARALHVPVETVREKARAEIGIEPWQVGGEGGT